VAQVLYSERQIELIREAGRVTAESLGLVKATVAPGVTTKQLNALVSEHIQKRGGTPVFLGKTAPGKKPFPAVICASKNDVVVHGIPDEEPLAEGDVLSVDVGVMKEGYIGDSAWTFPVGKVSSVAEAMLEAGEKSLFAGLEKMCSGGVLSDISSAVQNSAEGAGWAVVRDYVGHGVGRTLWEEPQVPNYVSWAEWLPILRTRLRTGMVLAIEPMLNERTEKVLTVQSEWPVRTADGGLSVHFEHTATVTERGAKILTLA
jgi:methionyl aminopeptidase